LNLRLARNVEEGMKELLAATVLVLSAPAQGHEVKVYFSKGLGAPGELAAVTRTAPGPAVARFAIEQLIAGPTKAERRRGLRSELSSQIKGPSDCGADFRLTIAKGTATLRFYRMVVGQGVMGDARILAALQATLKQFGSVKKAVVLDKDGGCLFAADTANRCRTGRG
jgi:hypothetical protein